MEDVSNSGSLTTQADMAEAASSDVFVFPASFAQQRLWFLDQLQPGQNVYNVPFAIRLTGSLRVDILRRCLETLIQRHEILRTVFSENESGNAIQLVRTQCEFELPLLNLQNIADDRRDEEARAMLLEFSRLPFDLQAGPLFRANLLRLKNDDHVLSLVFHHIILDGWSWGVVLKEIVALYKAFLEGHSCPLPDLPIQYGDYAIWQHEQMQGERLAKLLDYWRRQLDGAPPILELPTDFPRPAVQSYQGEVIPAIVSKSLLDRLQELASAEGCTLYMVLLAAFSLLLSRYSRQDDVVVGTPIAGRLQSELEQLIGFFVNTLAFRTDLSGNPPFRELLRRVREVTLAGFAHQELPFEKLVEELRPERRLSHTPLFQAMLFLQNAPRTTVDLPGLQLSSMDVSGRTAKFDLMLSAVTRADGLRLGLTYNVDLFRASTMEGMLSHLQNLLQSIVADPSQPISSLAMIGQDELQNIISEQNKTERAYPEKCVHELFEAQAEATPDAIAVIGELTDSLSPAISANGQLTYADLNQKANQLAHYLAQHGVKPGSRVGICMERSLEMAISVLATLKAGAAYVPLDPEYPRDRIAFMAQDASLALLLTQERMAHELATQAARVLCVDSQWPEISKHSSQNPVRLATPENLVYVIYTSGSTGRPKGVCLPHRSLSNLLYWQRENSSAGVETRTLQFTSLSFDVSFQEIFSTWCSGGTLVLISESVRRDPLALLKVLREHQIARLFLPFVALQQLAEAAEEEQNLPQSLAEVVTAGEQLHITRQLANLFTRMPGCKLFNHYGPSESHVVTSFQLTGSPDTWDALPPIGKPIANTQIYILDSFLNPVPNGVSGELYIGGISLADGYLDRPEMTAERFIANPFVKEPGARLYRTGDLCRFLPDRNIQYLGRVDNQVKLRGYRIELGEVESVLAKHPAVQHAVAVVREDVPGDRRLVAYVVTPGQEVGTAELRDHLKQALPDYMVPSAFVKLDALPLTPSGKVSRRALPAPDWDDVELATESSGFRSPVEELLAGIWSELLRRGKIGPNDNFFELGGHSLLATQLASRIRRELQVELALRSIFEYPTIAELARHIESMRKGADATEIPPLVAQPRKIEKNASGEDVAVFPLSFAEQRLWVLDRLEPNTSVYNLSIGLRLRGLLDLRALELSIEEIQRRHEVLRATFRLAEGGPEQCIGPLRPLSIPLTDISDAADPEAKAVEIVRRESRRPFDLGQDPMLRPHLLRLSDSDHVLLLTVHHIVFDGWSRSVLVRELSALYQAYSEGKSSPLPDLPLQYTDFAAWQRKYLSGEVLQRQVDYWKQQLAGAPSHIDLPTDRPRPPEQTFHGSQLSVSVDQGVADKLNQLSRKTGVTLFMTLLGAFNVLLSRYSGQDEIVVGSPIAGRNQGELEKLIGFFVNTLPLRTSLAGEITFRELLARVRDTTLEAYSHQDLPFEKLVEEIKPERDPSRNPIFQVMFALQNLPKEAVELPGLRIDSFRSGQAINAKFDISLIVVEHPDKLTFLFEYNTDLFDRATVERMAQHFQNLLGSIATDPSQNLALLPMLSEAERSQLLDGWNETREYPVEVCIHQLFEQQVKRAPNNVALVFEGASMTYAELHARSNQLARYLRQMGVGPDVLVGLCVENSFEMVVGILGIIKAGGAYLPLDPRYPKDRLLFMVEDAKPPVVLTQSPLKLMLSEISGQVVALDTEWSEIAREEATDLACNARPEHLAYVIYTSGSTGRPKGCQITHANVVRLFSACQDWYAFDERDVWTMFHSYAFDFSVWELWGALIYGGRLVIVPYMISRSPKEFYALLESEQVTVLNQTPSSFRQLIEAEEMLGVSTDLALRYVIFGGEALEMQSLRPWFERHGDQKPQLVNMYGITETTVHVTYRPLSLRDTAGGSVIGCPIPDLQVYLLDRHLQPTPIGVPGEMYVGGAGVARGYLNRPELNRERFIPDIFRPGTGNRLYKSGDQARRLANGDIEYLGRIDQQVKIRGFRIELGEIESALMQHPRVKHAIAIVREDSPGDKRLVAYLVADGSPPSSDELRAHLKQNLPEYMVPSAFVALAAFPLTNNGKVDRRALPAPGGQLLGSSDEFVAPRTSTEQALAAIWAEVLRVGTVSVHHNFFALGGHSLLATQVVSRVQKQLGRELPLRTVFANPTLAALAKAIDECETTVSKAEPVIAPIAMNAFRIKKSSL